MDVDRSGQGGVLRIFRDSLLNYFFAAFQYPELLVSSYNENEAAPQDPGGVALVWNMKYSKTSPEYVFHNQVSASYFYLGDLIFL